MSILEKNSEKSSDKNSQKSKNSGLNNLGKPNEEKSAKKPQFLYSKKDNFVRKFIEKNECIINPDLFFFIYQESEGQLLFLHPLNYKYLLIEYGSTDHLPLNIDGKIVCIDVMTLSDEILKRYKFLNHLPENSDVRFVEIQMDHLLKNRENLKNFKAEVYIIT